MPLSSHPRVRGLVLAAGAGRRMGAPKALLPAPGGGTLVEAAVRLLREGGCDGVTVVVGAEAAHVRPLVELLQRAPAGADGHEVEVVECPDWNEGMGASLRAGLRRLRHHADTPAGVPVEAVLVTLVDLPDLTPAVVHRLLAAPGDGTREVAWRRELRRAAYDGAPGHPALIGRDFWDATIESAVGDRGAREVYRTHPHRLVECGDLATGRDIDTREEAGSWGLPSTERGRE